MDEKQALSLILYIKFDKYSLNMPCYWYTFGLLLLMWNLVLLTIILSLLTVSPKSLMRVTFFSMALQSFGPWQLFQFLNPIHSR
jgi:hypothetical protein